MGSGGWSLGGRAGDGACHTYARTARTTRARHIPVRPSVSVYRGLYRPGPGAADGLAEANRDAELVSLPEKVPLPRLDRVESTTAPAADSGAYLPGPRYVFAGVLNRGDERLPKPSPARDACE